jgi:hypothetical protein
MRKVFEASWPPPGLAERLREGVIDGTEQSQSHNATRAA